MNLNIRADASTQIGAGHVMRCLALAQACRSAGGKVVFQFPAGSLGLEDMLKAEGFPVRRSKPPTASAEDAASTLDAAKRDGADWIVLDGYGFQGGFQGLLKEGGARVLTLDDNSECAPYQADVLLNQNLHANTGLYSSRREGATLLLGTRYCLIRKEFLDCPKPAKAPAGQARRILVTLGGGDPDNVTEKVLLALRGMDLRETEARIVTGWVNPHADALQALVDGMRAPACTIIRGTRDMPGLMAWADFAICAGGSTVWEMMYMGVPLIVITAADNQRDIARSVAEAEAGLNLGWHADLAPDQIAAAIAGMINSPDLRGTHIRNGTGLVDGQGAARVLQALEAAEAR